MKVTAYCWLLGLAALLAVGNPASAQAPAGHPAAPSQSAQAPAHPAQPASVHPGWWHQEDRRKELGLTNEQIVRLDHIWDEAIPHLTEEGNQLDEREARLSRLIEMNSDDDQITHWIDRVETARSLLNKDRQLMLIHMRQVLTPDQQVKFSQRWARQRAQQQQQQPQRQGGPGSQSRPPQAPGGSQRSTQPPASSASPGKRPE